MKRTVNIYFWLVAVLALVTTSSLGCKCPGCGDQQVGRYQIAACTGTLEKPAVYIMDTTTGVVKQVDSFRGSPQCGIPFDQMENTMDEYVRKLEERGRQHERDIQDARAELNRLSNKIAADKEQDAAALKELEKTK